MRISIGLFVADEAGHPLLDEVQFFVGEAGGAEVAEARFVDAGASAGEAGVGFDGGFDVVGAREVVFEVGSRDPFGVNPFHGQTLPF